MSKEEKSQAYKKDEGARKKRSAFNIARGITAGLVFIIVAVGLIWNTGTGTLSSLGIDAINLICPLGALESVFGNWVLIPRALIALGAIALIVFIVGKAFCSWVCPIPHIQNPFKSKKRKALEAAEQEEAAQYALENWKKDTKPARGKTAVDARHAVLGGALLSTAVFGFPVFCLVCPVGLTFATFILGWRFIQFNEPTWGLLIFPAIIIIEVIVLRKWCMKICPLGALLSLLSRFNKTLRPTVNNEVCLRDTNDAACNLCDKACPELVDPYDDKGKRPLTECVKCHKCADACPVHAIKFPFVSKRKKESRSSVVQDKKL